MLIRPTGGDYLGNAVHDPKSLTIELSLVKQQPVLSEACGCEVGITSPIPIGLHSLHL